MGVDSDWSKKAEYLVEKQNILSIQEITTFNIQLQPRRVKKVTYLIFKLSLYRNNGPFKWF